MRPHRVFIAACIVALAVVPAAWAKNPPHPSGLNQPLKDGCQRSDFGVGLNTSPEWVYVYKNPTIRTASGVVRVSHPSIDDAPFQHHSYDYNGNLVVGSAFKYLIAGSTGSKTNNFAPQQGGNSDEEYGRLHFEWESGTMPFFVWPNDGDNATIWGSWIWDCGHWSTTENNAEGSTTTGEHSELHPINAIVVYRKTPFAATGNATQTDVFISNDGTSAHAVEQCALSHKPQDKVRYDPGFQTCTQKASNAKQPLLKSYTFHIPAPKKPAGAGALKFTIVKRGGSGSQKIKVTKDGLDVTVKPKSSYGRTFFVSWAKDKAKPTPLHVTLRSILINHADPNPNNQDGSDPDKTPPWMPLYLDINGSWTLLNNFTPELNGVTDGQLIQLNASYTISVPKGQGVWFQMSGRECDVPADTTVLGVHPPIVKPCGPNRDEVRSNPLLLLANDDPGIVLDRYPSAAAAIGDHTSTAALSQTFPGSGSITFGHGFEMPGVYTISYSIEKG